MKWCYSEVILQFYKAENVIKFKGAFRNPTKVKMWPTVFTDTVKGRLQHYPSYNTNTPRNTSPLQH